MTKPRKEFYDIWVVGERLKEARKHRGLTQIQLENLSMVPRELISYVENERRPITMGKALKLSVVLGCSLDWLLGVIDEPGFTKLGARRLPRARRVPKPPSALPSDDESDDD